MKLEKLKVIQEQAASCTNCELHKGRTNSVFAKGNADSRIVLVGEAPGFNEDLQGIPFCGRSGKLLDSMIASMGLTLNDVYVCNIVKCRPPNNRKPMPGEMAACIGYLLGQLEIVKPKVIITLGATATDGLLGPGEPISKRRGVCVDWQKMKVIPTFHPSYILRNQSVKPIVAEDLGKALQVVRQLSILR